MSNETKDQLIEYRGILQDKIETAQMRHEINAMESALSLNGQAMAMMESGSSSRNYTAEMYRKEIGFEDANQGPFTKPSDRDRGKFEPFIRAESDIAHMRAIGRYFMNSDCAGVGIKEQIVNYVIGEGFKYDVKIARPDAPQGLLERVTQAVEAILTANKWCGCREEKPLEEILADGEVFLILRDHEDGIPRIRIRSGEHFVEPVETDIRDFEAWEGMEALDWSFGIATPFGESEAPVAYFAQ